MEENIEINEYVRTKNGKIDKVINNDYYMRKYVECENGLYLKENIAKHSPNLIDLIEVGDYVNGKEVMEFDFEDGTILGYPVYTADGLFNTIECYVTLEQVKIKTILTYEQFKSVSYEV